MKLKFLSVIACAGMVLVSCEGPQGIQGEKGDKGDKGDPGTPGTTLACAECHNNDDKIIAFSSQWEESTHNLGENAGYANRTGCVQCHTSQGFLEYVAEGSTANISVPVNPLQINCFTCHKIHQTYTEADFALTKGGAQTLEVKYKGADVVWDKGTSNQCVFCHQERAVSNPPVEDGPDYAVTSSRIGPHHGPNSNLILGKHPFELAVSGTTYPTSNPHSTTKGCVTCHMSTPYGYMAGGHNMGVWYDSHGTMTMLKTGCATCHTNSTTLNTLIASLTADVTAKMSDLEAQLIAAGIYNPTTGLANNGTYKANVTLAYLNYNTVKEDRSNGIHNPGYIKQLLDNSIAEMTAAGFPAPAK